MSKSSPITRLTWIEEYANALPQRCRLPQQLRLSSVTGAITVPHLSLCAGEALIMSEIADSQAGKTTPVCCSRICHRRLLICLS